jgi:hypothetical protein
MAMRCKVVLLGIQFQHCSMSNRAHMYHKVSYINQNSNARRGWDGHPSYISYMEIFSANFTIMMIN